MNSAPAHRVVVRDPDPLHCQTAYPAEGAGGLLDTMGSSDAVRRIRADVRSVAKSDFTVLITGETGSGKELVARSIHACSARMARPFVAVDCGAIPETLLESDLFGHEKGAFTGADRTLPGKFEVAREGTLFLDEISNMSLGSQAKLLRALQERAIVRVGSSQVIPVNTRVLVAANEDLEAAITRGTFRRDLFFRLNEFVIHVPPLRERREDIPFLATRFLELTNHELGKSVTAFAPRALERLVAFTWPGNCRQLRSTIRRAVLLADDVVDTDHLNVPARSTAAATFAAPGPGAMVEPLWAMLRRITGSVERAAILQALKAAGWNKAKAARLLQIDYKTMQSKVREYALTPEGADDHVQEEREAE